MGSLGIGQEAKALLHTTYILMSNSVVEDIVENTIFQVKHILAVIKDLSLLHLNNSGKTSQYM